MSTASRVLLGVLLGVIFQATTWAADSAALVLLRTQTAALGDTLTVIVAVSDATALGVSKIESLDLDVAFDAAALEFLSVSAGNAFPAPECTTVPLPNDSPAGILKVGLAIVCTDELGQPASPPIDNGASLLVLEFRVAPGASPAADLSVNSVLVQVNETQASFDLPGVGVTDGDGDGINDVEEVLNGLDPTDPDDASLDPDLDGVTTRDELLAGSDPNDADSVPGPPFLPGDLQGTWDAYSYSDDASGANAPRAEECAFAVGGDGVLSAGECETVDGTGEVLSPGDLTLSISPTGRVELGGPFSDGASLADAHMDVGRTVIAHLESIITAGMPGEQALAVLLERGTGYRQAELAGTWHLFQFGDNAAPADDGSFWLRHVLRLGADGALLPGSVLFEDDAPDTPVPLTSAGVDLSGDGTVTVSGELAVNASVLWERMDASRSVIAGVARESFTEGSDIEDSLRVWVRQGTDYAQGDAQGVWHAYRLSDAQGVQEPRVSKLTLVVDASGDMTVDGFNGEGEVFTFEGSFAVSVDEGEEGLVTLGGELGSLFTYQHLRLDAGKTVLAGVLDEDDAGVRRPGLLVAVKSVASAPRLVFPVPEEPLEDTVARFAWTGNGTPATNWRLMVGTSEGSGSLFDSGVLPIDVRSVTVGALPGDGRTLHARLLYRVDGVWQSVDEVYTAADIVAPSPPSLVTPAPGSTLFGSSALFVWRPNGTTVTRWQLRLGSSAGGSDLFSSPVLGAGTVSLDVSGLPTDGRTIHARLRYDSGGFKDLDFTFEAAKFPFPAITAPGPGTTLAGSGVTFQWSLFGQPVEDAELWIGSAPGGKDLASSGSLGVIANSYDATALPVDGRAAYVRLRYRLAGRWEWVDYGYRAATFSSPALLNDTGSPLTGSQVLFEWTNNGQPVADAELWVGSRAGGRDLAFARRLGGDVNSVLVEGLPTDGRTVYVRLRTRIGRGWLTTDSEFTAADFARPGLTSPVPGDTLGTSTTFHWSFNGHPAEDSELWVGTTLGGRQLLRARGLGTADGSLLVENLPEQGQAVYVQFRYRLFRRWYSVDYQYKAAGAVQPGLTSPLPGSQFEASAVSFQWDMNGLDVTDIELRAGSRRGRSDLGNSGGLGPLATEFTFDALPGDGSLVYVQLRYRVGRSLRTLDYTFTAAALPAPVLLNDTGSPLPGSQVLFEWTDNGQPVADAELWVGSRAGGRDLAFARRLGGDVNSVLVEGLPTDGRTVYVRLRTRIGRGWLTTDSEFTAADFARPGLTSPVPGDTLGTSTTFHWSFNGHPAEDSELWVGTTLGGRQLLRARGLGTADGSLLVENLPEQGQAVYVQFRYRLFRRWYSVDYQYKAAGAVQPGLTSPLPGSQFEASAVSFQWDMNGLDVTDIELRAGSRRGRSDLGNSGGLGPLATEFTFDALPGDGSLVYVQLRYRVGRSLRTLDYTFTAAALPAPVLLNDTGSPLPGSQVLFEWTDNGQPVADAELWVGSRAGGRDLAFARRLGGDVNSVLVEGLPTDGRTVYVRLRTRIGRGWLTTDSVFMAPDFPLPALTTPAPGGVLTDTSTTFEWTFNGHPVEDSELWVGTTPGGRQVEFARRLGGDTTSLLVENIPAGLRNVYVRFRYRLQRRWYTVDYVVSAAIE